MLNLFRASLIIVAIFIYWITFHKSKPEQIITLAYVTPWNGKGYDVAKSNKFTLISPVWFDVKKKNTYLVEGMQNIDNEWIQALTSKIVPRFRFDFGHTELMELIESKKKATSLVKVLVKHVKKFDGMVLECMVPQYLTEFIQLLGKELHKLNKILIVVLFPLSRSGANGFTKQHLTFLGNDVDYYSLMTYDYNGPESIGPNAPVQLIENDLKSLCDDCSKILMGLQFYGNDYTKPKGGGPIIGSQYLELIEKYSPKMQWDHVAKEHYFEYANHIVYYPTPEFIRERLEIAKNFHAGISIWEIGQGLDSFINEIK